MALELHSSCHDIEDDSDSAEHFGAARQPLELHSKSDMLSVVLESNL